MSPPVAGVAAGVDGLASSSSAERSNLLARRDWRVREQVGGSRLRGLLEQGIGGTAGRDRQAAYVRNDVVVEVRGGRRRGREALERGSGLRAPLRLMPPVPAPGGSIRRVGDVWRRGRLRRVVADRRRRDTPPPSRHPRVVPGRIAAIERFLRVRLLCCDRLVDRGLRRRREARRVPMPSSCPAGRSPLDRGDGGVGRGALDNRRGIGGPEDEPRARRPPRSSSSRQRIRSRSTDAVAFRSSARAM